MAVSHSPVREARVARCPEQKVQLPRNEACALKRTKLELAQLQRVLDQLLFFLGQCAHESGDLVLDVGELLLGLVECGSKRLNL